MTHTLPGLEALSDLSTLEEPVRRRLYEYVVDQDEPVSRDQGAAATAISRTLAAYHLDKLAKAGLLAITYARPVGRGGPGAGRPAKLYARAERDLSVSVPPREYELLARLLVESVEEDADGQVREAVNRAARKAGQAAGALARELTPALRHSGYQPRMDRAGAMVLRNCPFHQLAQAHQSIVCELNLSLVAGIIEGAASSGGRAVLDPGPDRCCVVIQNPSPGDTPA